MASQVLFKLLEYFFNFGYYVFAFPYRVTVYHPEITCNLTSSPGRKVIVIITQSLAIWSSLNLLSFTLNGGIKADNHYGQTLLIWVNVAWIAYELLFLKLLWNKVAVTKVFQDIQRTLHTVYKIEKDEFIATNSLPRWRVFFAKLLPYLWPVIAMCWLVWQIVHTSSKNSFGSVHDFGLRHSNGSAIDAGTSNETNSKTFASLLEGISILALAKIPLFIGLIYALLLSHMGMFFLISIGGTVWIMAIHFVKRVKSVAPTSQNLRLVIDGLHDIHRVFDSLEDLAGLFYAHSTLMLVPAYAAFLPKLVDGSSPENATNFLLLFGFLIPPAILHLQLKKLPSIIQQRNQRLLEMIEPNYYYEIESLCKEIMMDKFGLRGVFFTLTFGFVGNLLSLIITYAIIISQFSSAIVSGR